MNTKDIQEKSTETLAAMLNEDIQSGQNVLIKEELKRRERIHQHELDLKLITKQVKWMKFSVCAIIIAAIISGLIGYGLTKIGSNSINKKIESLENTIQIHISEKKKAHYKETIEQ